MSAQVSNTVLVMSFAQAKLVATGFTDTAKMLATGVRKATPYIKHGATAVHGAMTKAYEADGKVLSGFKLSSFKHAHAVAVLLAKHGHTLTDEDFDRWAVAGVRIVRTVKFGGVMKFTDVLATEGVGTSLEAVEAKADEIEQSKTDERRDESASKRAARPNDGSKVDADEPSDEPSGKASGKASGTASTVVATASDTTSLREVSDERLIREIEGRIRTGSIVVDVAFIATFDRLIEAYTEALAQPAAA